MIAIFFGYILWIFISKIVTPDIIGISSTVISLTIIFSAIVDVGVSTGVTRFLARSFSERQIGNTVMLVKASLLIIFSGIVLSSATLLFFNDRIYSNIEFDLVLLSIPLVGTFAITGLLRSILVASLETKSLPKIMIVSSICRIVSTVILVLLGTGAIGITVGYLSSYISAVVFLSYILVKMLMPIKQKSTIGLLHACKNIFVASIPAWITQIIGIVGTYLGTIIVFGIVGASEAGSFFIASSIFHAIASIKSSIFDIAFPIVSAIDDQRKRFIWKLIKMSLILTLPISSAVVVYSDEVMLLIGSDYLGGSIALKILMLSMLTITFNAGIVTLLYSYGNYRKVLSIGLGSSLSRVLFYFILVPLYGNTGAALSFTVGSIVAFIISLIVAKNIGMKVFWKELALIFIIPTGLAFIIDYFHVNYIVGIPFVLIISSVLFFRLHILFKSDIRDYLEILPNRIGEPLINFINRL